MNNNFLRIKFDDIEDKSVSYTLNVYHLVDKLLEKFDEIYKYQFEVKEIRGKTVIDIFMTKKKLN
tara:strand:- start:7 stop:201 length:195 start_codon:yes stop_codon:yes gene_type:complete